MSLALLVPMRGQPIRRELFAYTFLRTLKRTPVQVIVRADDDDPDTAAWVRENLPCELLIGPRYDGYKSLPRFFNEMVPRVGAAATAIMCGNDDMRFETEDWAGHYLRAARRYRGGLFNLGCMTHPAGAVPFSCVSPRLVEELGFLNDERLCYSDIFLRDVHARLGCMEMLPKVSILHIGTASVEAQETKAALDTAYWPLHRACVAEAVERLRPVITRRVWGWRLAMRLA